MNTFLDSLRCYDALFQMLRTRQAVLLNVHDFFQCLKEYHLQFLEVMSQ